MLDRAARRATFGERSNCYLATNETKGNKNLKDAVASRGIKDRKSRRRFLLNHPLQQLGASRSPSSEYGKRRSNTATDPAGQTLGRRKIEWKQATGRSDPRGIDRPRSTSTRTTTRSTNSGNELCRIEGKGRNNREGRACAKERGRESSTRHSSPVIEARKTKKQAT